MGTPPPSVDIRYKPVAGVVSPEELALLESILPEIILEMDKLLKMEKELETK